MLELAEGCSVETSLVAFLVLVVVAPAVAPWAHRSALAKLVSVQYRRCSALSLATFGRSVKEKDCYAPSPSVPITPRCPLLPPSYHPAFVRHETVS